jgi:transcriptional regulator
MYLPPLFAVQDLAALNQFMEQYSFATLLTQHAGEMIASHIPFVIDRESGPYGRLRGHLAIGNPQLAHLSAGARALVMFQGPHAYISPSWYATPHNVPTWNYTAVHAHGTARVTGRAALVALLQDLVRQNEKSLEQPWSFDAEAAWVQRLLPEIAAFEIPIEALEGTATAWSKCYRQARIRPSARWRTGSSAGARTANDPGAPVFNTRLSCFPNSR